MPRNQLPADPLDRLREVEQQVERLERELAGLRNSRQAEGVNAHGVLLAETCEEYNTVSETYSYPAGTGTNPSRILPIKFIELEVETTYGQCTYTKRSQYACARAISPLGWFPPGCLVEVAYRFTKTDSDYGARYHIINGPPILHGRSYTTILAADWGTYGGYADACRQLVWGSGSNGWIAVFRETATDGTLEPLLYQDGSAVLMKVWNTMEEVEPNKGLTVIRDEKGRWIVVIDPCNLQCSES